MLILEISRKHETANLGQNRYFKAYLNRVDFTIASLTRSPE